MTDEQRTHIQNAISELAVGDEVKLADLLGDEWDAVGDDTAKRQLGKEFNHEVQGGQFANLRFVGTDSANHAIYART